MSILNIHWKSSQSSNINKTVQKPISGLKRNYEEISGTDHKIEISNEKNHKPNSNSSSTVSSSNKEESFENHLKPQKEGTLELFLLVLR